MILLSRMATSAWYLQRRTQLDSVNHSEQRHLTRDRRGDDRTTFDLDGFECQTLV